MMSARYASRLTSIASGISPKTDAPNRTPLATTPSPKFVRKVPQTAPPSKDLRKQFPELNFPSEPMLFDLEL
jgi:hypothetical protein